MLLHDQVLSQAALTEFKTGDPERGRGVFEGILRNYPKRLDLWSIYLDQARCHLTSKRVEIPCSFFVPACH